MLIDEILTEKTLIDDLQLSTTSVSPGSEQSPLMQVLRLSQVVIASAILSRNKFMAAPSAMLPFSPYFCERASYGENESRPGA